MKTTFSLQFDDLNTHIIKMIPHITSIWMTHLFSAIVHTKMFPRIRKITRILPLLKPQKISSLKENYRPIADLNVLEKGIKELIKIQLLKHLEKNYIILKNHHGGIKQHSSLLCH